MRRGRRQPPTTPDARIQQRLSAAEGAPEAWRSFQSSDSGPLRLIRGRINTTTPSISEGGGFTISSKPGTGQVVIAFSTAFPAAPVLALSASAALADWTAVSASGATLRRYDANGTLGDGFLDFIAIGPA